MSLKSDLARVRGLGSAKDGTHHFWHQRLTAIALIPLSLWFISALLCMINGTYFEAISWIAQPHVTTLLVAFSAALFYHVKLGLQTVVEDYIHTEWLKLASVVVLNLGVALCGLVSIVAILKISFTMS